MVRAFTTGLSLFPSHSFQFRLVIGSQMTKTHNSALNMYLRYIGCETWQCFKLFPALSGWQLTGGFYVWNITVWEFLSRVMFCFKFIAHSSDINIKWKQIGDCPSRTWDCCKTGGNGNSWVDLEEHTAFWNGWGGKFYLVGFLFFKLRKVISSFIWPEFYSGFSHF